MARNNAGTLAGLAALAGAAYLNRDKLFGSKDETPKGKEDTGPGYKSTETREEPRRKIEDYQKKAPLDGTEMYPSGVMGGARQASRTAPAPAPATAPIADSAPVTTPMASTADRTDQLAGLSRAVKREDATKKAAQGEFKDVSRVPKNDSPAAIKAKKMYDTMSEKSGAGTSSAQKTDALAVASRAARAADAKRRAAKQSAYKKGGMTSTASSASKRADGIASKGKTKCKMY